MKSELKDLHERLKDFGLDPADWILETTQKIGNVLALSVRHRADNVLVFEGFAERNIWLQLSYQG